MINLQVSTSLLIIISIVILVLIVAAIIYIIYKDKREDREEIEDLIDDLVKAKPRNQETENLINSKFEIPIGIPDKKPEKVDLNKTETKIDLENMLTKMQEDLESKQTDMTEQFESEQEDKAIISYQELINNMHKDNFKNDIETHEYEQENDYQRTKDQVKEFLMREEPKITRIESPAEQKSKFKNTEFISPVFGKMNAKIEYPKIKLFDKPKTDIEKYFEEDYKHAQIDYKKDVVDNQTTIEEILDIKPQNNIDNKNDDFLNALKEFRSNL